ncbi:hypothetical protein [Neisseria sicca]
MAKRIYELNQSGKFSAFYLDQDKFSYFGFCNSKRLSLDFIPRFEIEAKSTKLKNHHILLTNTTTILVDKKLADFLINKYNQEIQIIPIELVCKGTILSGKYFLINSLHTENIIDEQKSERIYIDENTSFLSSDNMKLHDNSLKVIGIGRHNNPLHSTKLFFSDELISELHEHGFDRGFIFA